VLLKRCAQAGGATREPCAKGVAHHRNCSKYGDDPVARGCRRPRWGSGPPRWATPRQLSLMAGGIEPACKCRKSTHLKERARQRVQLSYNLALPSSP
jgi:hypothetical protein